MKTIVHAVACCVGFVASTSTIVAWLVGVDYALPFFAVLICAGVAIVSYEPSDAQRRRDDEFARRHRAMR